ncbi:MAG: hypothetical protein QXW97_00715 [Candidatus Pacearchaeota archaeon]
MENTDNLENINTQENKKENNTKKFDDIYNEKINKRIEKIKSWLKNPYNLSFLILFIIIIIIRFYFFILTSNQPLWWDESQYMSKAKDIAGIVKYDLGGPRTPFYSYILSLFFILNLDYEPFMRFVVLLIPSLLVILLIYLCIKEMYLDRKIAIISLVIAGLLWEHLFYSNRFHTENFSLIFLFLATLVLFKVYIKREKILFIKPKYALVWIIVFFIISVLFRAGTIMAFPSLFLFILILNKDKLFYTKKGIFLSFILALLLILAIIYVPKMQISKPYIEFFYKPENPIAWHSLSVFKGFYQSYVPNFPSFLLYFFIIGIIIFFFDLFLGYERLLNIKLDDKNLNFKSDIFNFLTIFFILITFIFLIRSPTIEYRWFFPLLIGMFSFTANGIIRSTEYVMSLIGIKNKIFVIIIIAIIVFLGAYDQFKHSEAIIKIKLDSYIQVKEAGLWIKQNSNKDDLIISSSHPQTIYYSERNVETFYVNGSNENETAFNEYIKFKKPKFVIVSIFEPSFTPHWAYEWANKNNQSVKPVRAYFLDQNKQQLALVIYEVDYSKFGIKNFS